MTEAIVFSLQRCAYLLHRIEQGDTNALRNASQAVEQARQVLADGGYADPLEEEEEDMSDVDDL